MAEKGLEFGLTDASVRPKPNICAFPDVESLLVDTAEVALATGERGDETRGVQGADEPADAWFERVGSPAGFSARDLVFHVVLVRQPLVVSLPARSAAWRSDAVRQGFEFGWKIKRVVRIPGRG